MDHETARMDRFEQGVRAMSPQERDAMKAALKANIHTTSARKQRE